jgi:hypothetical protein
MRGLLLFAVLGAACTVTVDHSGHSYTCQDSPECPPGFDCMDGVCRDPLGNLPSTPDASQAVPSDPDAVVTAATIDAAVPEPEPDAEVLPPPDAAPPGITNLLRLVTASSDDAEELVATGAMSLGSSDLEMALETDGLQYVGMRFTNVEVPQGATILRTHVRFTADADCPAACGEAAALHFHGEASANAATFTTDVGNISGRILTAASVDWAPDPWLADGDSGDAQTTPDLAAILQEIVNQPEWIPGNAVVIYVEGSGARVARTYNQDPASAARLFISYE